MYLSRIAFYREKFRFRFSRAALMTNHVDLAIRTGATPLSKIMAGASCVLDEVDLARADRLIAERLGTS